MESTLNGVFNAGMVLWLVGTLILIFRTNTVGDKYLSQLPPVDGVPLHMYRRYYGWTSGRPGPVWRAWRQPQADPELERLRQEGWRRFGHLLAWIFGFPLLLVGLVGVISLLISTGVLR